MSEFPPPGSPPPPGAPPPDDPRTSQWHTPSGPAPHQPSPSHPSYAAYPSSPPQPGQPRAAGMLGAAHKPGAIPLRPLSLGDLYDGAFRIIRFNPKATVGSAVLVSAIAMAVPVLAVAVLTWTVGLTYDATGTSSTEPGAGEAVSFLLIGVGAVLQAFGLVLVTGMVVHVVAAAAVGRRLTLGEAWTATRGQRWRLLGLALVLGLAVLLAVGAFVLLWVLVATLAPTVLAVVVIAVSALAFLPFMFWFWIRVYYLAVPPLMLEGLGVFASIARGYRLSLGGFWRLLGIALLTWLIGIVAGQVLSCPFSIGGTFGAMAVGDDLALFVTILGSALAQVAATAFVAPFTSGVTSLQYLDQRIRKEAYDVDLMRQAGILES